MCWKRGRHQVVRVIAIKKDDPGRLLIALDRASHKG